VAEPERLVLPGRQDVREWRRVQTPRDAWLKAVYRMVPQVSDVLRVVLLQQVAPLPELLALLQAQADESELLPARLSRVQQASRPAAPLQVQAPVPWLPLEQRTQALPVRLALPLAQREPRARSV
jgi:hypothetical protein